MHSIAVEREVGGERGAGNHQGLNESMLQVEASGLCEMGNLYGGTLTNKVVFEPDADVEEDLADSQQWTIEDI